MADQKNLFSQRYQLTLDRVRKNGTPAYSKEMVLADAVPRHVRRFTEFSGDVSGRYVGALACAAADRKEEYPELRALLPELVRCQKPEGYFGDTFAKAGIVKGDMAVLWGNGRLLIGLLEYARVSGDQTALAAARRMGDFLVRIAPEMNSDKVRKQFEVGAFAMGYICWTQIIEGLAELHRVTRVPAYRQVAEGMAARTERRPNEHSHGLLSSVRGILDLHQVTGEARFLEQAEREWQGVVDSGNVFIAGSIPEAWKPKAHRTEGCAEADWLRLSLRLWAQTRKPRYLEQAERTLFNEFAMNQFDTGDFGHRVLSKTGSPIGGNEEGGGTARAWWCCTLHGLRTFPDVNAHVFRRQEDALAYDLPLEGRTTLGGFSVQAESALESEAVVRLKVVATDGKAVPLLIREPAWVWGIEITVNGLRLATLNRDGHHRLSQNWKENDVVAIKYLMKTRGVTETNQGRIALFHGPWLLGANELSDPFFFDEPHQLNVLGVRVQKDGTVDLERDAAPPRQAFAVPQGRFRAEYQPGGYRMAPSKVTLRPVAEQTGQRSAAWEYWFQTKPVKG
jgi:DUF1680 family protein